MVPSSLDPQFVPLRPWAETSHYLLGWYDKVHQNRDMPWRQTRDPYAIWLSETMLQQTQVATVKPYYARFLERFPTVSELAKADLEAVLALWSGLGYYRRARHLHAAARVMVERHAGQVPGSVTELLQLPGIGRYTAGAVASIAFGLPVPVVDGNVMRVIARVAGFDRNIADPKNAPFFWEAAAAIVKGAGERAGKGAAKGVARGGRGVGHGEVEVAENGQFGDVNQALMELGATVCTPGQPACLICPLKECCRAFAEGRQRELPIKARKKAVPEVRGVAVVVVRGKVGRGRQVAERGALEVLLMKRPAGITWEGMWEFPVIAPPPGAKRPDHLVPAIAATLGLHVQAVHGCGEVVHTLTHRRMVYEVVRCHMAVGHASPKLPECLEGGAYVEARWVQWPLGKRGTLACGRVVEKIAAAAGDAK